METGEKPWKDDKITFRIDGKTYNREEGIAKFIECLNDKDAPVYSGDRKMKFFRKTDEYIEFLYDIIDK